MGRTENGSGLRTKRVLPVLLAGLLIIAGCAGQEEAEQSFDEASESDTGEDTEPINEEAAERDEEVDAEAFYEGQTIEIIVPFGAGGGTDAIGRFLSEWYMQYLPGNPTVQVRNVPGGGSILGGNEFHLQSPRDGSVVMLTASSNLILEGLGHPAIEYDTTEWTPVLGAPQGAVVFVRPDLGLADDWSNSQDLDFVAAMREPGGVDALFLLAYDMLEIDVTPVFGYESAAASRTAFEQGESNIEWSTTPGYRDHVEPMIEAGEAEPWFSLGAAENGSLVRDPAHPDVPHIGEVYEELHGEPPSGELWDIYLRFRSVNSDSERIVWLHSDAPPEAIEAFTEAGHAMVQDPDFVSAAEESMGPYAMLVGDDLAAIRDNLALPPADAEYILDFLYDEYGYELE